MEIYKNPDYSIPERVEDLMNRMTLEEKVCQLTTAYAYGGRLDLNELASGIGHVGMSNGTMTPEGNAEMVNSTQKYLLENTRLGIPAIFHVETLNGGSLAEATTYPIPLGLAASFDEKSVHQMGEQLRKEMVATGQKMALAPVLDISRDPRWGRMGETYGESPTLTAVMGTAYVSGIQGQLGKNGMSACAKHFLGYAASEGGLNMAGAHIGPRELKEVYAKPFAAAIQNAGMKGVMNCYLAVDGEPATGTKQYLTDLLRGELGFDGTVVADYGSIDKLSDVFGIAKDKAEAGTLALSAGLDVETPRRICLNDEFIRRVESGEVPIEIVDTALRRNLTLKFQLGLFEHPYVDAEALRAAYHNPKHTELSYRLACESMTLLKNEGGILPLKGKQKIAVIGPNAANFRALFGGYTYPAFYEGMRNMLLGLSQSMGLEGVEAQEGQMAFLKQMVAMLPEVEQLIAMNYPGVSTVLDALKKAAPELEFTYAKGCSNLEKDESGFVEAITAAKDSDAILFVCGGRNGSADGCTMGENVDSSDIGLPGSQEALMEALGGIGVPLIVVHLDGKPLSSVWAAEHAAAILEAWHPGQMGAQAITDTIFGKNNPSGKLPVTALRHAGQIPIYAEQPRGSGAGGRGQGNNNITQGYVDEPGFALYPFGHGLSYTSFTITNLSVSTAELSSDGEVTVFCTVENTGKIAGSETVFLYFIDKLASVVRPNKELAGFAKVELQPGERRRVSFTFHADQTAFVDRNMDWLVERGETELLIGSSSEKLETAGMVRVTDSRFLPQGRRHYFAESAVTE